MLKGAEISSQVLTDTLVHRIIIDDGPKDHLTASGVEFLVGKDSYVVKANKEVILCAGYVFCNMAYPSINVVPVPSIHPRYLNCLELAAQKSFPTSAWT